jgi:hypothetical protein
LRAERSNPAGSTAKTELDCFVAPLLAMTACSTMDAIVKGTTAGLELLLNIIARIEIDRPRHADDLSDGCDGGGANGVIFAVIPGRPQGEPGMTIRKTITSSVQPS